MWRFIFYLYQFYPDLNNAKFNDCVIKRVSAVFAVYVVNDNAVKIIVTRLIWCHPRFYSSRNNTLHTTLLFTQHRLHLTPLFMHVTVHARHYSHNTIFTQHRSSCNATVHLMILVIKTFLRLDFYSFKTTLHLIVFYSD